MSIISTVLLVVLGIVILLTLIKGIFIVPQTHEYIIERLGVYKKTSTPGLNWKIPWLDTIRQKVDTKEQVADFPPQAVITKDNVSMQIDTVVFYRIFDSKNFTYGVTYPVSAIEQLTATTLRNLVGDLELDETLTSRDTINTQLQEELDEATDPWGIKITRVELKNIIPPRDIQEAMEKQMRAEREKREKILRAEGEKTSQIMVAEGQKEAAILNAEAENKATVLRADAEKEKLIREAEGEALAIKKVQQAKAEGIKNIRDAQADEAVLKLKSLETFAEVSKGQATKIIIPSDIQDMAGLLTGLKETIQDTPYVPLEDEKVVNEREYLDQIEIPTEDIEETQKWKTPTGSIKIEL